LKRTEKGWTQKEECLQEETEVGKHFLSEDDLSWQKCHWVVVAAAVVVVVVIMNNKTLAYDFLETEVHFGCVILI
jgi:hypothetical protein